MSQKIYKWGIPGDPNSRGGGGKNFGNFKFIKLKYPVCFQSQLSSQVQNAGIMGARFPKVQSSCKRNLKLVFHALLSQRSFEPTLIIFIFNLKNHTHWVFSLKCNFFSLDGSPHSRKKSSPWSLILTPKNLCFSTRKSVFHVQIG